MPTKTKREKLDISFFQNTGNNVRQNITVLPELQALIPPLASDEFEQLRQNILTHGCREPLSLWQHNGQSVLIDGHNRYRICTKHQVSFDFKFYDFANLDEVKDWMLANQLGRRNLTPLQQSYLRGKRYAHEKQTHGGLRISRSSSDTPVDSLPQVTPTASQLAQEYGVNEKTIRRDEQFALGLEKLTKDNEPLRWQILNGQAKASKKTIADLAEAPAAHLRRLNRKLAGTSADDTPDVDLAVKQFRLAEKTADNTHPVITPTLANLKKQITTTTSRAVRTRDPATITELHQLIDQLDKAIQ